MTGSSSQRRKALRAQRWKDIPHGFRRPTDEEIESIPIYQPEKPAEAEDAISAASALRSGGKPPKEVIPDTSKPIAPPEPRGEAEGALPHIPTLGDDTTEWVCEIHPHKSWEHWHRGKWCPGPGMLAWKKRRTLWNWLRKLVG